ncbi:hypothetical protein SAM23877_7101 [Streptomyces ambofaciens ATCC 23877]|uniref:RNA polymerase ECF-subfamily sigma factor n=1 Tax=Streptomyces ambofaciens (strain ATCC 23877 / 3486 / DSM 40053 / JCM 4204 / NBRC 12836 / NRRL B-2516) TaxID=278992 RepID=A0A0K2B4E5_STRA7|nr:hypothetical protein SAM23877_7101 [Streptomyces ambofaciens ATCC 23877]
MTPTGAPWTSGPTALAPHRHLRPAEDGPGLRGLRSGGSGTGTQRRTSASRLSPNIRAPGLELLERSVNGVPGLVARRAGVVMTVASFGVSEGRVTRIRVVRNPEKLRPWAWEETEVEDSSR